MWTPGCRHPDSCGVTPTLWTKKGNRHKKPEEAPPSLPPPSLSPSGGFTGFFSLFGNSGHLGEGGGQREKLCAPLPSCHVDTARHTHTHTPHRHPSAPAPLGDWRKALLGGGLWPLLRFPPLPRSESPPGHKSAHTITHTPGPAGLPFTGLRPPGHRELIWTLFLPDILHALHCVHGQRWGSRPPLPGQDPTPPPAPGGLAWAPGRRPGCSSALPRRGL